jgi:23S rRNA pseudouridine1911/1915/1917 synthase
MPTSPAAAARVSRSAIVPRALAGERVDRVAAELFDGFSRAVLARWIQAGRLTANGAAVRPRDKLRGGETLRLDAELEPREDWRSAQQVPFTVVFEDADLLVVDKPPGVVVHPGAGNPDGTLVNGLLLHRPELARLPRAGIVHRLDKDTSGLLLVAATETARTRLVAQLAARDISRRYLAVVEGCLTAGLDIDRPIGRDPALRTRQRVRADGRPALTRVRVLSTFRAHTLIEAQLETGRTHQIRVHLAHVGHPLVGDVRYGARLRLPPGADAATQTVLRGFRRQALHAWRLAFRHPVTGTDLAFEAPVPEDLAGLIDALAADAEVHAAATALRTAGAALGIDGVTGAGSPGVLRAGGEGVTGRPPARGKGRRGT